MGVFSPTCTWPSSHKVQWYISDCPSYQWHTECVLCFATASVSIRSGWLSLGLFSPCLSKLFYGFIALQSTSAALLSSPVFLQQKVGRRWEKVNRHSIILSLQTLEGMAAQLQIIVNVVVNIGLFWAPVSTVCILLGVFLRPLSTSEGSILKMWRGSLRIGHEDEDTLDKNALELLIITVIINPRFLSPTTMNKIHSCGDMAANQVDF